MVGPPPPPPPPPQQATLATATTKRVSQQSPSTPPILVARAKLPLPLKNKSANLSSELYCLYALLGKLLTFEATPFLLRPSKMIFKKFILKLLVEI